MWPKMVVGAAKGKENEVRRHAPHRVENAAHRPGTEALQRLWANSGRLDTMASSAGKTSLSRPNIRAE